MTQTDSIAISPNRYANVSFSSPYSGSTTWLTRYISYSSPNSLVTGYKIGNTFEIYAYDTLNIDFAYPSKDVTFLWGTQGYYNVGQFEVYNDNNQLVANGQVGFNGGTWISISLNQYSQRVKRVVLRRPLVSDNRYGHIVLDNFQFTPITTQSPIGYFDGVSIQQGVATGWSVDPDNTSASNTVDCYVDNTLMGRVIANSPSPDVPYPGNHRFRMTVPLQYRDGNQHQMSCYGLDLTGDPPTLLSGSPKTFKFNTPIGWLESVNADGEAIGWSLDPDLPAQSNVVHFYINAPAGGGGTYIGETVANLPRPDVNQATGYPGNHGYSFSIPAQYRDGVQRTLYAYGIDLSGDNSKPLSGNPKTFNLATLTATIDPIDVVEKYGEKNVTVTVANATTAKASIRQVAGTTGNATFADGSTEIDVPVNASQQLTIKGVTESSQADNFILEVKANGNQTVLAGDNFTVAVITALEFERINTTGINPDVPLDFNPGIDGMHTPEEGWRIFPDKNAPSDGTDRATLRVKATVAPANVPNMNVYFASFDLDDPSATGLPIDTTGNDGVDNNGDVGGSKSGDFSNSASGACGASGTTGTVALHIRTIDCPVSNNTTSTDFKVTMQPGDNFAVAATLDDTYRRDAIRVNTMDGSRLINAASQIIPISGEPNSNNVQGIRTDMLTVWRRLHIEVDSMGNVTGNHVKGVIPTAIRINTGNQTLTVNVPLEPNRFENGLMVIGKQRLRVIDYDWTVNPPIFANTESTVTVSNPGAAFSVRANQTFTLYDDDDMDEGDGVNLDGDTLPLPGEEVDAPSRTLLQPFDTPCPNVITATDCNSFAPAYIRPLEDLTGDSGDVPFFANVTDAEIDNIVASNFYNKYYEASETFWTIYLLGAYQHDPIRDADPAETNAAGFGTTGTLESTVFQELCRPTEFDILDRVRPPGIDVWRNRPVANKYTTVHEIGHLFRCMHDDGLQETGDAGVMAQSGTRTKAIFNDYSLNIIRGGTGVRNP